MTTVVLVGVLATMATYSVRVYAAHSKTAEAESMVGAIGRDVYMAFYRDRTAAGVLAEATSSTTITSGNVTGGGQGGGALVTHHPALCGTSTLVPASLTQVRATKYQPDNTPGSDYETGDAANGWICLRFVNDWAQWFQYQYSSGPDATSVAVTLPNGLPKDNSLVWNATARGDLDGDGVTSWFALYGAIKGDVIETAPVIKVQENE